jgi:hypothetical protein
MKAGKVENRGKVQAGLLFPEKDIRGMRDGG